MVKNERVGKIYYANTKHEKVDDFINVNRLQEKQYD